MFVSNMRNKILEVSVCGLQREGLRFSVDSIARELKISKKTVYKFFSTKEELAVAVYEKIYGETEQKLNVLIASESENRFPAMLQLYYRSYCMVREELFNKFALNDGIKKRAAEKHYEVRKIFQRTLQPEERETTLFIIDGVLEKLNGNPLTPQIVAKLERLL